MFPYLHTILDATLPTVIAQATTQPAAPALPDVPESWVNLIVQITALITALGAIVGAILASRKAGVAQGNVQTLAATQVSTIKAINANPGTPNVPMNVEVTATKLSNDSSRPVDKPTDILPR